MTTVRATVPTEEHRAIIAGIFHEWDGRDDRVLQESLAKALTDAEAKGRREIHTEETHALGYALDQANDRADAEHRIAKDWEAAGRKKQAVIDERDARIAELEAERGLLAATLKQRTGMKVELS